MKVRWPLTCGSACFYFLFVAYDATLSKPTIHTAMRPDLAGFIKEG